MCGLEGIEACRAALAGGVTRGIGQVLAQPLKENVLRDDRRAAGPKLGAHSFEDHARFAAFSRGIYGGKSRWAVSISIRSCRVRTNPQNDDGVTDEPADSPLVMKTGRSSLPAAGSEQVLDQHF